MRWICILLVLKSVFCASHSPDGHAIGFYHERSRPDRDSYIEIKYENVRPGAKKNFHKYRRSKIDSLLTPYDYGSVMHYRSKAFSKNGKLTIIVKKQGVTIGQRKRLSPIDAQQADLMYKAECKQRRKEKGQRGKGRCEDSTRKCRYRSWRRRCQQSIYVKSKCKRTCQLC